MKEGKHKFTNEKPKTTTLKSMLMPPPSPTKQNRGDREHLQWIHDRIVNVYGESENVDFLIKMRDVIDNL